MKFSERRFRILVTRTDRLGDVMLATPVLRELRRIHPQAQIVFLVQKAWMPVLQYGEAIELLEYDANETTEVLADRLRAFAFHRAYVLRDEKKVSRAVKLAGIPERVGPLSSLRSFFTFNRGKFQKRARCRMHEAEYNLELVHAVMPARNALELPRAWVQTEASAQKRALSFIESHELIAKGFYIIHPGSSGSARYVKQEALQELARTLIARGDRVCVSGGPAEDALLSQFQAAVPEIVLLGRENAIGLDGMAEVYAKAKAVIAHGTGPLHLAAAVGAPTLAIFPPIFVLSEKRWGPLHAPRSVWTPPNVKCPAFYRCIGQKCEYYDCMDRFEVSEALRRLESIAR